MTRVLGVCWNLLLMTWQRRWCGGDVAVPVWCGVVVACWDDLALVWQCWHGAGVAVLASDGVAMMNYFVLGAFCGFLCCCYLLPSSHKSTQLWEAVAEDELIWLLWELLWILVAVGRSLICSLVRIACSAIGVCWRICWCGWLSLLM